MTKSSAALLVCITFSILELSSLDKLEFFKTAAREAPKMWMRYLHKQLTLSFKSYDLVSLFTCEVKASQRLKSKAESQIKVPVTGMVKNVRQIVKTTMKARQVFINARKGKTEQKSEVENTKYVQGS